MIATPELRAAAAPAPAPRIIRGYAAKFDATSSDLGGFVETFRAGAFTTVLSDDVRALINHDPNLVLGRTRSATLRLRQDANGLAILCHPPSTSFGADICESVARGDVTQMSFQFLVGRDRWSNRSTGPMLREVLRVDKLYDVSIVTFPAYESSSVTVRHSPGSITPAGPERRALGPSALAKGVTTALAKARCRDCGAPATSLEVEWRGTTPTGFGRCSRHLASAVRTPRRTSTPLLDAARRRQRLRELEFRLREAS